MPAQTPASASAQSPQATVRSRMMIFVLLLSLLYSAVILVQEWKLTDKANSLMHQSSTMRALLFQKGARLDLYDPQELFVRSGQEPNLGTERFRAPRLLSTRAVLIGNGASARVRDLGSAYTYDPLTAGQNSEILSLGRNTNFTYYIPEGPDQTHLRIDFARCGEIADIPLPTTELWYDARTLFDTLALPVQQKMTLSPAETSLALVHHDAFPRITLVQLIQRQAVALSVPSFHPEQLHFSPFFMDDQTLLFSVLDRDHWGTVRYRLPTGTYEILSENFTDHAYHSVTGDIMLQQSFFDETINVPFGSVVLLNQKRGIPARTIESITGPKESHAELFSLLFQKPEEPLLQFKTDLNTQSFNAIAESDLREPLRTFWRDEQLKLSHAVGAFHLFTLKPDDTVADTETIPFEIRPPATYAEYMEDAEPLLRALGLPAPLLEEYRKRSIEALKLGEYYTLVDDLSY